MSLNFSAKINLPKNPSDGNFRAFATLIVNDVLYINGYRVMDSKYGLFAAAPATKSNKQDENGRNIWYDDVRFREELEEGKRRGPMADAAQKAIIDAYNRAVSTGGANDRPVPTNSRPETPAAASGPARW